MRLIYGTEGRHNRTRKRETSKGTGPLHNNQGLKSKQDVANTESRRDQVEYMADLISELKEMAHNHKLTTLAGILELAHAEARLRARDII
jgi:hypothetical protein